MADVANAKISNMLVIGDDRQLGPYWPANYSTDNKPLNIGEDDSPESFFDHINTLVSNQKHLSAKCTLRHQYRLPEHIMVLLNRYFYQQLPMVYSKTPAMAAEDESKILWAESMGVDAPGPSQRRASSSDVIVTKNVNSAESKLIVQQLLLPMLRSHPTASFMIITPYKNQVYCLEDELELAMEKNQEMESRNVAVSTIDGAQV